MAVKPAERPGSVVGRGADGLVARPALFARLGGPARVTVVSAPAGSGKTVLLRSWIAGAGLDVFEAEPPGKMSLFEFDNVVLSPHAAGVDTQSRDDMALASAQSIVALSRGEWPATQIVNSDVRSRFKW